MDFVRGARDAISDAGVKAKKLSIDTAEGVHELLYFLSMLGEDALEELSIVFLQERIVDV